MCTGRVRFNLFASRPFLLSCVCVLAVCTIYDLRMCFLPYVLTHATQKIIAFDRQGLQTSRNIAHNLRKPIIIPIRMLSPTTSPNFRLSSTPCIAISRAFISSDWAPAKRFRHHRVNCIISTTRRSFFPRPYSRR